MYGAELRAAASPAESGLLHGLVHMDARSIADLVPARQERARNTDAGQPMKLQKNALAPHHRTLPTQQRLLPSHHLPRRTRHTPHGMGCHKNRATSRVQPVKLARAVNITTNQNQLTKNSMENSSWSTKQNTPRVDYFNDSGRCMPPHKKHPVDFWSAIDSLVVPLVADPDCVRDRLQRLHLLVHHQSIYHCQYLPRVEGRTAKLHAYVALRVRPS